MTPEVSEINALRQSPACQRVERIQGSIIIPESTSLAPERRGQPEMTDRKRGNPQKNASDKCTSPTLDEVWPVHSAGGWPQDLSLDRADIYEGRL